MAEFFVEILSEEIPAQMQESAERRFGERLGERLALAYSAEYIATGKGTITPESPDQSWSGPRRLAFEFEVKDATPHVTEEKKGPRADAPERAIDGFLHSVGMKWGEVEVRSTPKGEFLFATIEHKERMASAVLPQILADTIRNFTWPKTMRWQSSNRGWVRPVHRITALLDGKPLGGEVDFGGGVIIPFGVETGGHRILAAANITITGAGDYEGKLEKKFVIASRKKRIEMISEQVQELATSQGVTLREDEALLDEVAGLVEYPHVILGKIDRRFMDLPEQILVTSMRHHQKFFAFEDSDGTLAPFFATVANMPPDAIRDRNIREGNERVLNARLADAQFFWEADKAEGLEAMAQRLGEINFFAGLGTMQDKTHRIAGLAKMMATSFSFGYRDRLDLAEQAGLLAKADLTSRTVGEFPELQGVIGGGIAKNEAVGDAIAEHYRPQGPKDDLPETELGKLLAMADKIDTLVGFFGIGKKPTGSKDPFALRRATLGVIRIITETSTFIRTGSVINEIKFHLPLRQVFAHAVNQYHAQGYQIDDPSEPLLAFFHERLKIWLRNSFHPSGVNAVVRLDAPRADELLHLFQLMRRVDDLLRTPNEEQNLLYVYRRVTNILNAEERKDAKLHDGDIRESLYENVAEKILAEGVLALDNFNVKNANADDSINRLNNIAKLKPQVDAFFEQCTVNHNNPEIRQNRLNMLAKIRNAIEEIADLSAIQQ